MQEALLLQQTMGLLELPLRILMCMPVPLDLVVAAAHPVDLVPTDVSQTSEDLLVGAGEVVPVTHLPPSLEMLLIPEITESK